MAPEELARDLLALGGVLLAMIVGGLVVVPRLVRARLEAGLAPLRDGRPRAGTDRRVRVHPRRDRYLCGRGGSELQPLLVTVAVLTAFTTPMAIRAAPRVTGFIDRSMPGALRRLLALHEQWFEELRTRAARRADSGPVRRGLRALAVDAVLVLAIAASTAAWMESAVPALSLWLGIEQGAARVLWLGGALLVMLPVLVFAARSASAIAGAITQGSEESGPQKARSRALRTLLLIGLTALVGFPAATLIDAVTDDARAIAVVLILLAVLVVVALRSAREVDANVRSAAGTIAEALVSQRAPAPAPTPTDFGPIDRFEMQAGAAACGRTLAELDLRARTGATVVAIAREGGAALLPNGREQLEIGHVLALAGTPRAIAAAKEVLLGEAILASKAEAPAV